MEGLTVVLPARGEFGLKLRYHIPAVHYLPSPKYVFMEPGEEALFPSADRLHEVVRNDDARRAGTHPRSDEDFVAYYHDYAERRWPDAEIVRTEPGMPEKRFVPEPRVTLGFDPDIVVCPRWREYGSAKNWPGWRVLTIRLRDTGHKVAAAGAPDSSLEVPCERAWDYERFLDASIEMIRNADLVVATDAGLAHLAVLCGTDLLMVTYQGRIAPGPVVDSTGKVAHDEYWPPRDEYYEDANWLGAEIRMVDGWEDVGAVVEAVRLW